MARRLASPLPFPVALVVVIAHAIDYLPPLMLANDDDALKKPLPTAARIRSSLLVYTYR